MKLPDLDRIRSEASMTLDSFLTSYNEDLPDQFPRASKALLEEFRKDHASLFVRTDAWSLDQHRKKIMDWLPARVKVSA
ncbi:MAG: hypothetical protein ABIT47_03135 [Candidatus Paceibacterota bacterium]